jgi:hypothetical protein
MPTPCIAQSHIPTHLGQSPPESMMFERNGFDYRGVRLKKCKKTRQNFRPQTLMVRDRGVIKLKGVGVGSSCDQI